MLIAAALVVLQLTFTHFASAETLTFHPDPGVSDQADAADVNSIAYWIENVLGDGDLGVVAFRPATFTFAGNFTLGDNVVLMAAPGTNIDVTSGRILEIQGPLEAGTHQIFSDSSHVIFTHGAVSQVYPEWWGAIADDDTDCTAALAAALKSRAAVVQLSVGTYRTDPLVVPPLVPCSVLRGAMESTLKLLPQQRATAADSALLAFRKISRFSMSNLTLDGDLYGAADPKFHGIYLDGESQFFMIENVLVKNFSGFGVYLDGREVGPPVAQVTFQQCLIKNNYAGGVYAVNPGQCNLLDCTVENNGHFGIKYEYVGFYPHGSLPCRIEGLWFEVAYTDPPPAPVDAAIIVDAANLFIAGNWFNMDQTDGPAILCREQAMYNTIICNTGDHHVDGPLVVLESGSYMNVVIGNSDLEDAVPMVEDHGSNDWCLNLNPVAEPSAAMQDRGRTVDYVQELEMSCQPSVDEGHVFLTAAGQTKDVTHFLGGVDGQTIRVMVNQPGADSLWFRDGSGGPGELVLRGNQDVALEDLDTITLIHWDLAWRELSRSENQ